MNTNSLKKFAQQTRRKLMEQVSAKLEYVLNTDSPELREKSEQVQKLKEILTKSTKEEVIDRVSYTWFNRFMALRFMDVNEYQPISVKILTPKDGFTLPEILDDAKRGHISEDLNLNRQKVYDLIDGKIPSKDAQNEAYKELLIASCNHLSSVFPFLFERINDYTELLLPDDLTSELSIIQDVRDGMTVEDCKEVEIIGWLYQFYISEKKDEVFASKKSVKKEDIPAATQLFTPRWIVEYMVQNTVGKLWLQNRPNSKLRDHMEYYIESPSSKSEDFLKLNTIEDLKLLDQACGSGHILVYGFDLLYKIYEEEGYNPTEIPELIITKNLHGFEIDERASQLSGMALMMKARSYHRRFFRKTVEPNILRYQDVLFTNDELDEVLKLTNSKSDELKYDLKIMSQATNFGSLIIPKTTETELQKVLETTTNILPKADLFQRESLEKLKLAVEQLLPLSRKYHCLVENPPYMGGGKMNPELTEYVRTNYPDAKSDLLTCFVERGLDCTFDNGYNGFVTMESWMFLSSFESFRKKILDNTQIHSLSHFGWHIMRIAFGTVSFIIQNRKPDEDFKGVYNFMEYDNIDKEVERPIEFPLKNERLNQVNQKDFGKIPGSPIGYWLSEKAIKIFTISSNLELISTPKQGLATTDNERFTRFFWETKFNKIIFNAIRKDAIHSKSKWFPFNKGGEFRKWFGNINYIVNWENDGEEIKKNILFRYPYLKTPDFVAKNQEFYFSSGITWSAISSGTLSIRQQEQGVIFSNAGMVMFPDNDSKTNCYVLNTKISNTFLSVLSPTLNFNAGSLGKFPIIQNNNLQLKNIIDDCIIISKNEWNSREVSWDFLQNELIRLKGQDLQETYDLYQQYWKNKFFQLHKNEEELNKQFIAIYGLQEELTPDVPLEDITILKEETSIVNNQLIFNKAEVFAQFISYAVGCMFGRYSLDKEGLILANQGETLVDYLTKIGKEDSGFLPDEDNIIPILDDEWFEDDIVGRFHHFLKASFGKENFDKNLAFVEECLGKDIRKYFVKDFYNDHIKRYKKRPIYWMFSSPKGSFNVLIYMHRYTQDTLNKILNDYLIQYREKLNTRIEHLEHIKDTGSSTEQIRAEKEINRLKLIIMELVDYERDIFRPLAIDRIGLDLDYGVLVNYNKFGKAIKEVAGLNDTKTKKKVKEFDWIKTEEIR